MQLRNFTIAAVMMLGASTTQAEDYNMVIKLNDNTEITLPTSKVVDITFKSSGTTQEVFNILTPTCIPDEALRDYIQTYIAEGSDTYTNLQASLYEGSIDIQFSEIRNAEGLEYFTKVEEVILANNDYLTRVDVSALKNLRYLDVSYTYTLSELNISGLKKLEYIDVSSSQLKSFRLSTLPATIREIRCDNMMYPSFDPKSFPVLEVLQASQCNWKNADFSNHGSIREVYLSGNALTSAKFTNCRMLEQLALSYNTELNSLDLDGVSNLKGLFIHNTRLNGFDFTKFSNTLQELNIANLQGYDFHVIDMPVLSYLECQNCWLDGELIIKSPLKTLRCEENQLTKVDISACPEFENLYCYSMNTIKELILPTEQSFVKVLTLKDMPLVTDIKLTNLNNIEYFTLARSGVTTLDLSQANPDGTYYLGSNTALTTTKVWPDFDAATMGERWTVYNCPDMQITK